MDGTLWSTLPNELVREIFARLPPAEIMRLQCLSKEWKWNLTSRDSEFKRACASPQMFAMVHNRCFGRFLSVKLYDIKANKWHSYKHGFFWHDDTLYAGDGGLVCVVSIKTPRGELPLITVFNPLDPRRNRVLPHEAVQNLELEMVQLVMDRDRRCYKVLAVGYDHKKARMVAKIFSSETGAWNGEIFQDLVFGHQFFCGDNLKYLVFPEECDGPCAYDSEGRQLLELNDSSHPCLNRKYVEFGSHLSYHKSSQCYALVKDHLFVLHEESYDEKIGFGGNTYECQWYCISEYRGEKCEPHWVKLRTYECKEFGHPRAYDLYTMSLYACKGFLLVKVENKEDKEFLHVLTWLYDMVIEKWKAIPPFAEVDGSSQEAMFELQWDAIP